MAFHGPIVGMADGDLVVVAPWIFRVALTKLSQLANRYWIDTESRRGISRLVAIIKCRQFLDLPLPQLRSVADARLFTNLHEW